MIPASEIIADMLIAMGLAVNTAASWQLFIGFLPGSPDEAIVVYDTAGVLEGRIQRTGETIEHYGINVQVRGRNYPDAFEKVQSIAAALDAVIRTTVARERGGLYIVHAITRTGAVLPVGVEVEGDRRRHYFSLNVITTVTKVS